MVSVVNGFVCFSSCDAAKAKQGKDPHPSDSTLSGDPNAAKKLAFDGQPAVILDGALKQLATAGGSVDAVNGPVAAVRQQPSVNILA